MLLSNKGLLPVLWELFPGHPNLLPAYEEAGALAGTFVRKPKLSREGANVSRFEGGVAVEENGAQPPADARDSAFDAVMLDDVTPTAPPATTTA